MLVVGSVVVLRGLEKDRSLMTDWTVALGLGFPVGVAVVAKMASQGIGVGTQEATMTSMCPSRARPWSANETRRM